MNLQRKAGMFFSSLAAAGMLGCTTYVVDDTPGPPPPPIVVEAPRHGPPPWAPARGHRRNLGYRYYPAHHVYYSIERDCWAWPENGRWRVEPRLPLNLRHDLREYRYIELDDERPWLRERPGGPRGRDDRDDRFDRGDRGGRGRGPQGRGNGPGRGR